ncbi:MAG: PEP-CTERM sorting domain-containing protein [Lentimonas sp.]
MKNTLILAGALLASTLAAQASIVYSTDFADGYTSSGTGAHFLGGATPNVSATNWFGSTNGVSILDGDLTLANTSDNRFRGAGVWLDTTGWANGLVTVEIDAANFTAGTDSKAIFQAYAANGVDASNSVSLDLHGSASAGALLTNTGSATIGVLGAEQTIVGNGTDIPFTFTFNGSDQFIGLVFANVNITGGSTVDIDNLTVTTVPESGTYALLAGLTGLVSVMLRRRRS